MAAAPEPGAKPEVTHSATPPENTVVVRFLQKCSPYQGGEKAGFTPEQARLYVDAGVAVYLRDPSEAPPPPTDPNRPRVFEGMSDEQVDNAKEMIGGGVDVAHAIEMAKKGVTASPAVDPDESKPLDKRETEISEAADDVERNTGERPVTGAEKLAQDAREKSLQEAVDKDGAKET